MILPSNLPSNGLKLFPRKLNTMTLYKSHQDFNIYIFSILAVYIRYDLIELESILFDKLLS